MKKPQLSKENNFLGEVVVAIVECNSLVVKQDGENLGLPNANVGQGVEKDQSQLVVYVVSNPVEVVEDWVDLEPVIDS